MFASPPRTVLFPATAFFPSTNCPRDSVSFGTAAYGTGPFSFQWAKDGIALSRQTDTSLTLSSLTASSAGIYSVQVVGACNSATNFASLTVNVPTTSDALVSQ